MGKIRNFLCFFICSFHLNCPTTEEQITDRQVLLGVTQKVSSNSKHTLLCLCGHNVLERIKPNTMIPKTSPNFYNKGMPKKAKNSEIEHLFLRSRTIKMERTYKKHKKFLIFLINKLDFIYLRKIRNNDRTIEYII